MTAKYDLTTYDGKRVDWFTRAALEAAAAELGYDLTITQGSYNTGKVGASAGTHDGGGVVDLAEWDWARKVRVLRKIGFAAWHRTPAQGPWPGHIHAVLIGNERLSPSAARQVSAYLAGRNGLANNGPDDGPRDFVNNRFKWKPPKPVKPLRVDGVDISHHQRGVIDYAAAKAAGVKWVYHKATEGATYRDPNYNRRRAEVAAAGLPFGAYHFARAERGDAAREARAFIDYADPKPGDLLPALDLETMEGLPLNAIRRWAAAFVAEVVRLVGVKPVIYTPFDLGDAAGDCLLWRPRYNDRNEPPKLRWDIWQFSNGQYGVPDEVPGFGHVDLNTMRAGLSVSDLTMVDDEPEPYPLVLGTANLFIRNRAQAAGVDALLGEALGTVGRLKVGFLQECAADLPDEVRNHRIVRADGTARERMLGVVLPNAAKVDDVTLLPGTPGTGSGVNRHPRRPLLVTARLRKRKLAMLCVHPPFAGPKASKKVQALHGEYAAQVVASATEHAEKGYIALVGGDGNNRPPNDWPGALWRQLEAAGYTVVRHGLDLLAYRIDQVTPTGPLQLVDETVTGSNHAAMLLPTTWAPR